MITDIIVGASAAASLAFVLAWLLRPDLRAWIERPKYRFLADVRRYDRAQPGTGDSKGSLTE
jgi:hypothetical protein